MSNNPLALLQPDNGQPIPPIRTREDWLAGATMFFRPVFSHFGLTIPKTMRYAIAFTSAGKRGKVVGECWPAKSSADGHTEIFLRADIATPLGILETLYHECIHAALPYGEETPHGPMFKRAARSLGLVGPLRSTKASAELADCLNVIADHLGPIPHAKLNFNDRPADRPPKQDSRLLKAQCPVCGYVIRVTRIWAENWLPICPGHAEFVCPVLDEEEG